MRQARKVEGRAYRGGTERRDAAVEQLARAQPLPVLARHQSDPHEAEHDEAEAEKGSASVGGGGGGPWSAYTVRIVTLTVQQSKAEPNTSGTYDP